MAFSLRLPPALEADARARCERLGISLNALLCVALDAYLREPALPGVQHPPEASAAAGLVSVSTSCTNPEAPSPGPAPVPEPVPVPASLKPRKKPVLTAPPVAAPTLAAVAPPALSRAERRRLEHAAKKR
jgi:hypothetical protein